jgi:hypothetical protein
LVTVYLKGGTNNRADVTNTAVSAHPSTTSSTDLRITADTSEALALSLGQSRVQLGLNVPAKCYPVSASGTSVTTLPVTGRRREEAGTGGEDVVLYFGIIDILQVREYCLGDLGL